MGSGHHEEVAIPLYVAPVVMSSEQHQPFKLGENTSKKIPSKGRVSKSNVHKEQLEMLSEDTGNGKVDEHSLPEIALRIHRPPWLNRKAFEAEEIVKYMSSIPRYLQREEKGSYNIQEKALNVGVLDWRRLQKWTDHEKQLVNNMKNDSPSSSNLSTFCTSPFSSRSNIRPSTHESKQSSSTLSTTSNLTSSAEKDKKNVRRKDSSKNIIKFQDAADIIGSLPSVAKVLDNIVLLRSNESTEAARLAELEKIRVCIEKKSSRSHLNQDGERTQRRKKHLEEIIARSVRSFDTALLDQGNLRRMNSGRLSGNLSLSPHSSVSSCNIHREEPLEACILPSPKCSRSITNNTTLEVGKNLSFEKGRELLPIVLPSVDLKGRSGSPLKSIADNHAEAFSRSSSRGRRSPVRLSFDQAQKSTSSVGLISDNPDVAGARSSSRGSRSPVKQMLLDQGRRSPLRQMLELPRKLSSSFLSYSQPPQESSGTVNLMHFPSTQQALLKLCWNNGQPLLMFSSRYESILVAMMHKRGNSDMNICDCVYKIHTAMAIEVKNKKGAWLSQGTKNKEPEFSSKFVAELIVSSSERVSFDLTHRSFIRELVLLGDELVPSSSLNHSPDDATKSSRSTELAAIVVKSSHQKSGSPSCGDLCSPFIVAILPSGVHGFSNTREPSKLIEKWESGGSCDCGGWDEGCALTILTNNSKPIPDYGDTIDNETCGFDLFTEGDARKGKPSFSMVSFKEDMFTVEFKASITLLQAFAISIAMLHDRNHLISANNYEDISFDSSLII